MPADNEPYSAALSIDTFFSVYKLISPFNIKTYDLQSSSFENINDPSLCVLKKDK